MEVQTRALDVAQKSSESYRPYCVPHLAVAMTDRTYPEKVQECPSIDLHSILSLPSQENVYFVVIQHTACPASAKMGRDSCNETPNQLHILSVFKNFLIISISFR